MDRVSTDLTGVKGEIENLKLNEEVTQLNRKLLLKQQPKE